MPTNFVKVEELLHSKVCKDIPPKYIRKTNVQAKVPTSSKAKYQKIVLRIPDKYAFALMEMYGRGLQGAIMKHIKNTIIPMKDVDST
jgi:hypothetical protein